MPSIVRYVMIRPTQEPADMRRLDENSRHRFSFNVQAMRYPKFTEADVVAGDEITKVKTFTGVLHLFMEEVVSILEAAGVGTRNTNIFLTTIHQIPTKGGPFLSIQETGGLVELRTHDLDYSRPSAQIVTRSPRPGDARLMAWNAYNALKSVENVDVTTS